MLLQACLLALALVQVTSERTDATLVYARAKGALVQITAVDGAGQAKMGSGVILRADGLIATNYHVIAGATSARVKLANGDIYDDVAVAETDERKDLAILKIKAVDLPWLALGDADSLQIGATVYALGAPLGLENSLSQGLVSGIRPVSEISQQLEGFRVIQFTAPVSMGSSGGPLVDDRCNVVGLVSATLPAGQNLNLGIPANYISGLIANWKGESRRLAKMAADWKSQSQRTPAEVLASAKTLCVWVSSGSPVLKTEISSKLLKWGKVTLVSAPLQADLVLEVIQTGTLAMGGNQAAALLKDNQSGAELWSCTKGGGWAMSGWSNAWVGRAIADEFIKFFSAITKPGKK